MRERSQASASLLTNLKNYNHHHPLRETPKVFNLRIMDLPFSLDNFKYDFRNRPTQLKPDIAFL